MFKLIKIVLIGIVLLTQISCVYQVEKKMSVCPIVFIDKDFSYTKIVQHMDTYQIILDGYHSDCVINSKTKSTMAIIQPIFRIRRLQADKQINFPFNYFVKTTYGVYKHHQIATIPEFEKEIKYSGQTVNIPLPYKLRYETPISLGLEIQPEEQKYNNRYFDNKFNYSEEK